MSDYDYTAKQGQYLAFIYNYTVIHGRPPSEVDMVRFFRVSPPSVHQMVVKLDEKGLITREPGKSRTIQVSVPPDQLPVLYPQGAMRTKPATAQVCQIKVTLDSSSPPIWRRILVPGNVTLEKLHYILQVAMGWTDSHLHQFIVGQTYYGEPDPEYGPTMRDEGRVKLSRIVTGVGFQFRYEYDFGDSWLHTLSVEEILLPEPGQQYPVCLDGKLACPPEDVGGVGGYYLFLEAIQEPEHPEHEDYLEWIGGDFDPDEFDLNETNRILRRLR